MCGTVLLSKGKKPTKVEWRDPDSNRGHHDFQWCGPCSRLFLFAPKSAYLSQIHLCDLAAVRHCFWRVGVLIGVLHPSREQRSPQPSSSELLSTGGVPDRLRRTGRPCRSTSSPIRLSYYLPRELLPAPTFCMSASDVAFIGCCALHDYSCNLSRTIF